MIAAATPRNRRVLQRDGRVPSRREGLIIAPGSHVAHGRNRLMRLSTRQAKPASSRPVRRAYRRTKASPGRLLLLCDKVPCGVIPGRVRSTRTRNPYPAVVMGSGLAASDLGPAEIGT